MDRCAPSPRASTKETTRSIGVLASVNFRQLGEGRFHRSGRHEVEGADLCTTIATPGAAPWWTEVGPRASTIRIGVDKGLVPSIVMLSRRKPPTAVKQSLPRVHQQRKNGNLGHAGLRPDTTRLRGGMLCVQVHERQRWRVAPMESLRWAAATTIDGGVRILFLRHTHGSLRASCSGDVSQYL